MVTHDKPAVCLLSGGLDSTTALAIAKTEGFSVYALSFHYGQRHDIEVAAARRIAQAMKVIRHKVVVMDLRWIGGSALTDDIPVPKKRTAQEMDESIPVTYVPARNTIFLSYALAWAEALRAQDIFIGVNALDYSGYPDCRPDFIAAFEEMARFATLNSLLRIHTPLIAMTKATIIRRGIELGVDYSLTTSCYDPADDGTACGGCDSCQLRRKGFAEAGMPDPIRYATVEQAP